jgi:nucleotide-binding universal stress UspA family protein
LASVKRVDGVLVPKTISGKLDELLRGDPIPAHLRHCLARPVWFLEGTHIDANQAVIGMVNQEASLRAVRHAGSMLAGCDARIDLVHCDPHMDWSIISEIAEPSAQLLAWENTPEGQMLVPYLQEARRILVKEGISEKGMRIVVLPSAGDVARSILKYCRQHHVGIVVLGHAKPEGIWSFVQNSVTKTVLSEFKNMAVWVVQRGTGSTHENSCR